MTRYLALCLLLASCGGQVAEDPTERFAAAVCACGDSDGCQANVKGEAQGANPECLNEWAEAYERSCSGLPAPRCDW